MCFDIIKKFANPKFAKTDIVVYKTKGKAYRLGLLFRPKFYNKFVYLWNHITKKVNISPEWQYTSTALLENGNTIIGTIENGYHSYNENGLGCWFFHNGWQSNTHIYKFIIPKDTLYYENDTELVSEQIVYMGRKKISLDKIRQFINKYHTYKSYNDGDGK